MSIQTTVRLTPSTTGVVRYMNWSDRIVTIEHEQDGSQVVAHYRIGRNTGCTKRTVFEGAPISFKTRNGRQGMTSASAYANDEIVEIRDPHPCIDPLALCVMRMDPDWRERLQAWMAVAITHGPAWTKWTPHKNSVASYSSEHGRLVVSTADEDAEMSIKGLDVISKQGADLPDTMLQGIVGQPLNRVLGHRWFEDPDILVGGYKVVTGELVIRTRSRMIRIDALLSETLTSYNSISS